MMMTTTKHIARPMHLRCQVTPSIAGYDSTKDNFRTSVRFGHKRLDGGHFRPRSLMAANGTKVVLVRVEKRGGHRDVGRGARATMLRIEGAHDIARSRQNSQWYCWY